MIHKIAVAYQGNSRTGLPSIHENGIGVGMISFANLTILRRNGNVPRGLSLTSRTGPITAVIWRSGVGKAHLLPFSCTISLSGIGIRNNERKSRVLILMASAFLLALILLAQKAKADASAKSAAVEKPAAESEAAPAHMPVVTVSGQEDQIEGVREGSVDNGYRSSTESMTPLGKVPLKDTPYSINVTSGELIENSNSHSLVDAVRTNPTASMLMSSGGYSSMTRLMVRGFTAADQGELRDGLVDRSFSYPPIENVDRIEILNGYSGFFQGFSSPGGSVNYVSKPPTSINLANLRLGSYGGGINFVHGDLGGPVTGTDRRLRYRFNVYGEDGHTYIDGSKQERVLVSAVADYHFTPDTVLTADIWYQDYEASGLQTYFSNRTNGTWNGAASPVPSASSFEAVKQFGQSWTYNKAEKTLGGLRFESKLNDTFTLRAGYRHGSMWRQYDYVDAASLTPGGSYTEKLISTPRQYEHTDSAYGLMDIHVDTWGIHHDLTAGYSGTSFYYERGADVSQNLGTSSIASTASYIDPQLALGSSNQWSTTGYHNILIGDRIAFNDEWSAILGLNHAKLAYNGWTTTSTTQYTQSANTPTYALIYKPVTNISLYGSYMGGLVVGGTAPAGTVNQYAVLAPSIGRQYEVGAKTSFGAMDINVALFRINMINQETDPSDNTYKADGREIHQGLEVVATGKLTSQLTATGGFTLMNARVKNATADSLSDNRIPVNVPEQEASAYLEYALPWVPGLVAVGGANYYGRRPVDPHNTAFLDGAAIANVGLRYGTEVYDHLTSVNLNVSNLLDTPYWAYFRSGDGLLLGAPRLISLSLKLAW